MTALPNPPIAPDEKTANLPFYRSLVRSWRQQVVAFCRALEGRVETNETDIATNAADIATLETDVTELERTRNIWVQAYKISDQAISSGVATKVTFGAEVWDDGGDYTSSTFTAPRAGRYHIFANLSFLVGADGDVLRARIYKNGGGVATNYHSSSGSNNHTLIIQKTWELADTDTIEIYAQNNSNNDTIQGGEANTWLEIQYKGE